MMRIAEKASPMIFAILPVILASCGSSAPPSSAESTSAPAQTATTTKSGAVPAVGAHDPTVTVSPSENLADGEKVTVSVSGFGTGGKFFLSECANPSEANSAGCGPQLASQPFGVTNNEGSGSYPFKVSTTAAIKPYNSASARCSSQCVIVATIGIGYPFAYARIHFAKG